MLASHRSPCTAVYDLEANVWFEMENDNRETHMGGQLDMIKDHLLYFGGKRNQTTDDKIWIFNGFELGWMDYGLTLSQNVVNDSARFFLLSEGFC